MKKIKLIALSITICISLLLTGCDTPSTTTSGGNDSVETVNSSAENSGQRKTFGEIRESYDIDIEAIKSKDYDNLNFDKAIFAPPPEIDSISELKLVELSGKTTDEMYDYFCKTVDTLTDNKYTDEEKRYVIRFFDAKPDESKPRMEQYPNIDEYKNGQETKDPWLVIDNENYFIWLGGGKLIKFNNGDLLDYDGKERKDLEGNYTMLLHDHVLYTEDLTSTDTYRLLDGEISIADAAKFAQNYLDTLVYTPYVDANLPKPRIYAVNVFDLGNGYYGYDFMTTYEYNGVLFDRYESKKGVRGMTKVDNHYDKRNYGTWMGCIDMIRTNKIHAFADIVLPNNVVENEPTTEIIPVEAAADIVSDFFSGHMKFTITEVSMAWLYTQDYGANGEFEEQDGFPCWKFKMYANGEIYHTFVDVITGEVHLYIQAT